MYVNRCMSDGVYMYVNPVCQVYEGCGWAQHCGRIPTDISGRCIFGVQVPAELVQSELTV